MKSPDSDPSSLRACVPLCRFPVPLCLGKSRALLPACIAIRPRKCVRQTRFSIRFGPKTADDPFAEGPWCWLLREVRPLATPVECRGRQMLWEWTA